VVISEKLERVLEDHLALVWGSEYWVVQKIQKLELSCGKKRREFVTGGST